MKAIITGMNGTVAPYVSEELQKKGLEVISWDRNKVDTSSEESVCRFIKEVQPDLFFHIATGPVEWVEYIAKATKEVGVKLIFTSTVSVYSEKGSGPYDVRSVPNAEDDYGSYKIQCENTIRTYHPEAIIIRLGWQIGESINSNNMFAYLSKQQEQNGVIEASTKWYPSCSFLQDTAKTVVDIALKEETGTFLANSNTKYSFFEIVIYLNSKYQCHWNIQESTSLVRDDRMVDDRVSINELF